MPYFLQLSKIVVPVISFRSERLRSRRSAESVWSRSREKSSCKIKNPARAPGESVQWNGCARSSLSFYPVFVTNLTSCEKADPVRQQTSLRIRALPTSGECIRLSNNVKSLSKKFIACICGFHWVLWKSRTSLHLGCAPGICSGCEDI
jgi:hypothetical protein